MADPLSISASAAGLMSLAITACQSLAAYYASWKGYASDIENICQYLELVSKNMRQLQTCLDGHDFPATLKQQVESAILACGGEIRALEAELVVVRRTDVPENFQEKLRSFRRRAMYPFKEGTLKKIRDSLFCIQMTVDSAVNILEVDSLGVLNSTAKAIVIELAQAKRSIADMSEDVPSIRRAVDRIDQEFPSASRGVFAIGWNVEGIQEDMYLMREQLQRSEERLGVLPRIQEQIEHLPSNFASSLILQLDSHTRARHQLPSSGPGTTEIVDKIDALGEEIKRLQLYCISKPSLLREELDMITEDTSMVLSRKSKKAIPVTHTLNSFKGCTCSAGAYPLRISSVSESFQFLTGTTKAHRKSCPLSKSSHQTQTHTLGLRTIVKGRFLSKALGISLGLTRGAGGCSLSTSIRLQTLLRNDSPAFQLFDLSSEALHGKMRILSADEVCDYLTEALQKFKFWFSEGTASPNDINIRGQTILQLANDFNSLYLVDGESRSQSIRRNLLLDLAQIGVPVDHKDFCNYHLLNAILEEERYHESISPEWHMYSTLSRHSPVPMPDSRSQMGPLELFKVARDLDEFADFYDCGVLSTIILSKDQEAFVKILQRSPHAINERNSLGQTPLHLAADWPWGTEGLLKAGAPVDSRDMSGHYPLRYASMVECWTVFEILLDSGSPILAPGSGRNQLLLVGSHYDSLSPQVFDHTCVALAARRKQLAELAKRVLTRTEYAELILSNTGILDYNAGKVWGILEDRGFEAPSALRVPMSGFTVYNTARLTIDEMSKLYDVGFQEVDGRDSWGLTPFMMAADIQNSLKDSLSICQWLISKGANPLMEVDDCGTVQMTYLAKCLGKRARYAISCLVQGFPDLEFPNATMTDFKDCIRFIIHEAGVSLRDRCQCQCSLNGCSLVKLLLHDALSYDHDQKIEWCRGLATCAWQGNKSPNLREICKSCQDYRHRAIFSFVNRVLHALYEPQEIPESAFQEAIRLCLFMELELTHTCCNSYSRHKKFGRLEIIEIHDEESEMAAELESLCEEGCAKRLLYDGPFDNFLYEFLQNVRTRPQNRLTKDDIRKIEEIGVVLRKETLE